MKPTGVLPFPHYRSVAPLPIAGQHRVASARSIRIQLSNILKSIGFIRAERMKRFLEFVVEETLGGRADQLCEYSIGISVFGRDPSFEPGLDPIVRNDARRLRQKLLEYYQQCRNEDTVVIEIPKGGYVPVFRCRSELETANARHQFRLRLKLTLADGTDVWATDQEFQINENPEELCLALRLEVRNQEPAASMAPIAQSSNQAHRWNRSQERVAK
jgi:transcriptional antiterminator Rof (Rho-off)